MAKLPPRRGLSIGIIPQSPGDLTRFVPHVTRYVCLGLIQSDDALAFGWSDAVVILRLLVQPRDECVFVDVEDKDSV